jgi:D-arginine dehydrogenase
MPSPYDVLVVGAGIAGASIAAELAADASVVAVEREDVAGYHTTGRSAALYIASYGNPAIRALTAASRGFFDTPPDGFAEHPLLTPRGCLHIANAAQLPRLDALYDELSHTGVPVERLDAGSVLARVSVLRPEVIAGGVYEPGAADIDVAALHAGYLRQARKRGVRIALGACVIRLERAGETWRVSLANGEMLEAGAVVNAAGGWGDELAVLAGAAPVGLAPCRRTAMTIDPPPGVQTAHWPAVIDVDEGFYFKPESGRILVSPADETPSQPCDAVPDDMDVAIAIDRLLTAADIPVLKAPRAWAGLRTFTPDRTPVIGFDPAAPGFFWFAGQGGYGMQIAPAAARLGAALALRRKPPDDVTEAGAETTLFSPARFG